MGEQRAEDGCLRGRGRKADFSTPPFAKARTASVEMTVPGWDEGECHGKSNGATLRLVERIAIPPVANCTSPP